MSCRSRPQDVRSRNRRSGPGSLADRLFTWRKKHDFSQSEAAMKLQVSKRTLQEWEQGRAEPTHLAREAIRARINS